MTVGEYKGWKVQEVKKLIQKLLIERVQLFNHFLLIGVYVVVFCFKVTSF